MAERTKLDLGLTGYDELFMTDSERQQNKLPRIHDVPLELIDDFPGHPFKVRMDEDMQQLVDSIKERGVLTPITLREKDDGRYELVSGHRRKKACELAGLTTVRADIRNMTRDEAIIYMVESNFQRSQILPSEKAFSYKMRLEAMKRQAGRPAKDNSGPVVQNFSRDEIGGASGESGRQVSRYIRLTELIPEILEMVDEGKIAFRPAVEISYLTELEQKWLHEAMEYADATPSLAQAIKLKAFSQDKTLGPHVIEALLSEEKPNQREKFSFRADRLRRFIPESVPFNQTEDFVCKALEHYQQFLERQRKDRGDR